MSFDYGEYIASREWAIRKEKVRERSGGICERCGLAPHTSTHHTTYANLGNEPIEDLLGVCNPCHAFLSAKSDDDPLERKRLKCSCSACVQDAKLRQALRAEGRSPVFMGDGMTPQEWYDYLVREKRIFLGWNR